MKKTLFLLALFTSLIVIAQDKKCRDKELFSMLPNYKIYKCDFKQYDELGIYLSKNDVSKTSKKGAYTKIIYTWKDGYNNYPSKLYVFDNFKEAINNINGKIYYQGLYDLYFSFKKARDTFWGVISYGNSDYTVHIVKEKKLISSITFNEKHITEELNEYGKLELKGIYFDTDKSTLKPTSSQSLATIANYLNTNPNIKVFIVGHTDNTGDFTYNQKLSKARAKAVVLELIEKHQVNASQLQAFGIANLSPKSIEKSKNRRVEMVLAN